MNKRKCDDDDGLVHLLLLHWWFVFNITWFITNGCQCNFVQNEKSWMCE